MMRVWMAAFALVGSLLAAFPAAAASRLVNPAFDVNLDGWSVFASGGVGRWWAEEGYPSPGSASLSAVSENAVVQVSQCIVMGPEAVDLVAYSRVVGGGGDPMNQGLVGVSAYTGTDCAQGYMGFTSAHALDHGNGWMIHRLLDHALPAGTQSVRVVLMAGSTSSSVEVLMDNVSFGSAGTIGAPPVPPLALTNVDFDTGTQGWVASGGDAGGMGWTADEGYPAPGALRLNTYANPAAVSATQCIDVTAQSIDLAAYARILSTGGDRNYGWISISSFSVPGCAGGYLGNRRADARWFGNGWVRHALRGYALPAQTQSVMLFLSLAIDQTSVAVAVDHVAFGPAGEAGLPPLPDNALDNPDFTENTFGWTLLPGTQSSYTAWSGEQGYPQTGALFVFSSMGVAAGARQCVNIDVEEVDLIAYSKAGVYGSNGPAGRVSMSTFNVPDCAASYVQNVVAQTVPGPAGWVRHQLLSHPMPAGTRSAMVFLDLDTRNAIDAYIDRVALGASGTVGDPVPRTVSGTLSGMTGSGLVLRLNGGSDRTLNANGPFTFDTLLPVGSVYAVTVATQPSGGDSCTVRNGSGTIANADVTNVQVQCVSAADVDLVFRNGFER